MRNSRCAYKFLLGKPEGRNNLEDSDVDGRVILKWILEEWDGGTDWIDLDQDSHR
jgi:hypothetical protein